MPAQTPIPTSTTAAKSSNQTAQTLHTALLRRKEVEHRTALSRSRIYDLMGKGEFPLPVRLGTMSVAWASNEIDAWIIERLQNRRVK